MPTGMALGDLQKLQESVENSDFWNKILILVFVTECLSYKILVYGLFENKTFCRSPGYFGPRALFRRFYIIHEVKANL